MLKQKCNEKEEDEKGEIIEDVLQNQYTTVWKDITSEDGGEESLVTSMKDFNVKEIPIKVRHVELNVKISVQFV